MAAFDPKEYHIIGMSPGNSYFKDEEIAYLLKTSTDRFGRVAILIADIPAISTYIALGYPENRARRDKAIPKGNALKNRVRNAMEQLGLTEETARIINWERDIENNPLFTTAYDTLSNLYARSGAFHEIASVTTRDVLEGSGKPIKDMGVAVGIAVHYLLSELAFLECAPSLLNVDKVVYVYHRNWRVYEDYIAGKFDGIPKPNLDFILIENPYETYKSIFDFDDEQENGSYIDTLDRIEKTKVLRVGFSNYVPAFMHDRDHDSFSGIFYDIIIGIAKKHDWQVRFTEEVGYGVIIDGLDSDRFDIFGSTVWPTPERKQKAAFSTALYKSPVFAWVRSDYGKTEDEIRDGRNVRVAVKENDITDSIANADFPENRKVRVPQLSDTADVLKFVAEDRADFTFVEPYLAKHFNATSPIQLIALSKNPCRIYDNAFIMKQGGTRLRTLLNQELEFLKQDGSITRLVEKYTGTEGEFIME
jgi:cyclo(L-tyrosyl-L-tyrosyl) synthase